MRVFLVLGAAFGLTGVALGAFGTHALRSRLPSERLTTFEAGVRYQLWHALALFVVVLVDAWTPSAEIGRTAFLVLVERASWPEPLAGGLFVAGILLFSGSLYVLALTGRRAWGAVTPFGGACLVLGWAALLLAAVVA